MQLRIWTLVSMAAPWLAQADLPVHCVRHQVVGEWEFTLGPLEPTRSSCGHKTPDSQYQQPNALDFLSRTGSTTKLRFDLQEPNIVSGKDGSGTWTMIYDEAFEVKSGDYTYLAFSKFDLIDDGHGNKKNVSHCDQTQLGWYHDSSRQQWGCYVGKKVNSDSDDSDGDSSDDSDNVMNMATLPDSVREDVSASTEAAVVMTSPEPVEVSKPEAILVDTSSKASSDPVDDTPKQSSDSSDDSSKPVSNLLLKDSSILSDAAVLSTDDTQDSQQQADAQQQPADPSPLPAADERKADDVFDWLQSTTAPQDTELSLADVPTTTASAYARVSLDDFTQEPPQYKPWVPGSAGYDKPMPSEWQQDVASALNLLQLGWVAHAYNKFMGKSPKELNKFAGVRRHIPRDAKQSRSQQFSSFLGMKETHRHAHGHLSVFGSRQERTFDWRKKDGENWLTEVVNQGDCGSCYTISTIHMLTARNKIRANSVSEPSFSVSFPLYCSEYNQGCDGGYGFLQSKWSEDVGLVPESCAPFSDGGGACQVMPECSNSLGNKRYRAVNHHYVGGFYGAGQEDRIREELVKNGPLVVSFEPKEDFMYYKEGVYKSGAEKLHQEWEQVDHAVLLIGYGEDQSQAYWSLQNSWGTDWGEDGYFRMARGIDESGVESIAVAAEVEEDTTNMVLDDFLTSLNSK